MKKLLSLVLTAAMMATLLVGCGTKAEEPAADGASADVAPVASAEASPAATADASLAAEPTDVIVAALKGPTAMGMVSFMNQADKGELTDNNYDFTIYASPDEVTPGIIQGTIDIAAVPANLASVLYNKTEGGVQVLAINTLGILYIVENGDSTIASVEDLRGKTIYASGKGATPEYALNYVLSENGIDPETDVTIEWASEHSECLTQLLADPNGVAMLPQPFVTTAQMKAENLNVALDLTEEWEKLESDSALLTGVVVVRKAFAEEHPEAIEAFLSHYEESVSYVNANTEEAAALIEQYDIVPAAVATKALPACNITYIAGDEMKTKLSGYLSVLFEQAATAVGGQVPGDDFYYGAK